MVWGEPQTGPSIRDASALTADLLHLLQLLGGQRHLLGRLGHVSAQLGQVTLLDALQLHMARLSFYGILLETRLEQ